SSVLCSLLHSPVSSSLFGPNIFLRTLFSNTRNLFSSLKIRVHVSQPYKVTGRITVLYIIFSLMFFERSCDDKSRCNA
ncbi:hypothetical protein C0J52_19247, partial [Blattella germanica]